MGMAGSERKTYHHVELHLRSLEVSEIIYYKVNAERERCGSLPLWFDADFGNVNVNERYSPALFCQPDCVSPTARCRGYCILVRHCMTGLWIYILVLFSFAAQ